MKTTKNQNVATLRAAAALRGVAVDAEAGVIKGAAVATAGPAIGHGFDLDAASLTKLCELINAEPDGYKVHFKHPKIESGKMEDQLGAIVGRVKNARLDGDTLRADVHLGAYAKSLPGLGDAWTYLLGLAQDDPAAIGLSAVFTYDVEPVGRNPAAPEKLVARVKKLFQVDFVGEPAANPNGLLAAAPEASPVLAAVTACVEACRACTADLRACVDACAAMGDAGDAGAMAAVVAAAGRCAGTCRAMTAAARACVDACDAAPGAMASPETAAAASLCIRTCDVCADECGDCLEAMYPMRWGTSDVARACAAAVPACRTARAEMQLCQDACRPLTAPVMAYAAAKTAAADRAALARK